MQCSVCATGVEYTIDLRPGSSASDAGHARLLVATPRVQVLSIDSVVHTVEGN